MGKIKLIYSFIKKHIFFRKVSNKKLIILGLIDLIFLILISITLIDSIKRTQRIQRRNEFLAKKSEPVKLAITPVITPKVNIPVIFTSNLSSSADITNTWKTFSSTKAGIQLKYPDSWDINCWNNYQYSADQNGYVFRAYPRDNKQKGFINNRMVYLEIYSNKSQDLSNLKNKTSIFMTDFKLNDSQGIISGWEGYEYYLYNKDDRSIVIDVTYSDASPDDIQTLKAMVGSMKDYAENDILPPSDVWTRVVNSDKTYEFLRPVNSNVSDLWEDYFDVGVDGLTQKQGTEQYDGIGIGGNIKELDTNNSLYDQVKNDYEHNKQQLEADNGEMLTDIEKISYSNGYSGYYFRVKGLGEYSIIYLSINKPHKYLEVTKYVADPTNQGYEEIANKIISSIKIL